MPWGDVWLNAHLDNDGICRCHGRLSPGHSPNGDIERVTPIKQKDGTTDYSKCIEQRVVVWLACRKGERPIHPKFGCCIRDFYDEPLTGSRLIDLKGALERELSKDVFPEKEFKVSGVRVNSPARNVVKCEATVGNYDVEFTTDPAILAALQSQLSRALIDLGMKKPY